MKVFYFSYERAFVVGHKTSNGKTMANKKERPSGPSFS
jgi:hypothetical protein